MSKTAPWEIKFVSASLCSFSNLRKDRTITIHCSLCLQQETAIKKPLIATNNEQHQTSATVQIGSQHIVRGIKHLLALPDFYWKDNTTHHSPAAACLLWGTQLKDKNVWLLLHGNAIKLHMCLAYQFITVIMESWQNWAFLTALGKRLVGASPQWASCCSGELCCLFNRNPERLAEVSCLELCAGTFCWSFMLFWASLPL